MEADSDNNLGDPSLKEENDEVAGGQDVPYLSHVAWEDGKEWRDTIKATT